MNVAADPMSRARIRKMVKKLREIVGCEDREYFPIVQFIEWILANPDNGIDLEIVDPEEMQDTYGTTNTGNNIMRIRSDVYEGAIMGDPRHRFTLCHEVGHYFCISQIQYHLLVEISQDIESQNGRPIRLQQN